MNRTRIFFSLCFLAAFAASSLHGQTVITFEEFPFPSAFFPGTRFSTLGFEIQNLGNSPAEITPCSPTCADNGTQSLLTQVDGRLRLTHSAGQAFSIQSFDAAESFAGLHDFWARQIDLTGDVLGGGTVQASFTLDLVNDGDGPRVDFQTFVVPPTFANLIGLTITGSGNTGRNDFSLDNLQLAVVPEPSAAAIGMWGILVAVRSRRRRLCDGRVLLAASAAE
jgi:hypothetical protein